MVDEIAQLFSIHLSLKSIIPVVHIFCGQILNRPNIFLPSLFMLIFGFKKANRSQS